MIALQVDHWGDREFEPFDCFLTKKSPIQCRERVFEEMASRKSCASTLGSFDFLVSVYSCRTFRIGLNDTWIAVESSSSDHRCKLEKVFD
jgi:hypothetical protein